MSIKTKLRSSIIGSIIWPIADRVKIIIKRINNKKEVRNILENKKTELPCIFYCGVCESSNMGDIAQTYCTLNWMGENYPKYNVVICKTSVFMDECCDLIGAMKKVIKPTDLIFFQSGYNTHDLGGVEDFMHQKVIQAFPGNEIIMLPQTVYFKSEIRKQQCSNIYNAHPRMLFLARDPVSERYAKEMFPDLQVVLYPDIVTTLIGSYDYSNAKRNGIYLCRRKDIEQYYTEEDYINIKRILSDIDEVDVSDTIITAKNKEILKNLKGFVDNIVERFSKYRVVVTDKFHGLIFSIIAGTPVVVIKTKDHKVTSGYEWFSKIYPDIVYYAENQDEIAHKVSEILNKANYCKPDNYFKCEYYDNLYKLITKWEQDNGNM